MSRCFITLLMVECRGLWIFIYRQLQNEVSGLMITGVCQKVYRVIKVSIIIYSSRKRIKTHDHLTCQTKFVLPHQMRLEATSLKEAKPNGVLEQSLSTSEAKYFTVYDQDIAHKLLTKCKHHWETGAGPGYIS